MSSRRNIQRIDYHQLHSTGDIVHIEENLSQRLGNLSIHDSTFDSTSTNDSTLHNTSTHDSTLHNTSTHDSKVTDSQVTDSEVTVSTHVHDSQVPVATDDSSGDPSSHNSPETVFIMTESQLNGDVVDLMVMAQDVVDIIDESPVHDLQFEELNIVISKLEQLRTSIRRKEAIVKSTTDIPEELKMSINHAVLSVKDFIKTANDVKSKSNLRKESIKSTEIAQKERTIAFLLDCTGRSIYNLEKAYSRDPLTANSDDLLKWRIELPSLNTSFEKLTDNYKECLQGSITNADLLMGIKDIGKKYSQLDETKTRYITLLTSEINKRELDKHVEFNKSKLNIKLDKFSGYDSLIDLYTFRSNFEKMHLSSTPKQLLPDLLKNNYLSDPALTMVRAIDSIDTIWERLTQSFGDTKVILSKRLQQLKQLDLIKKDPDKLIIGISRLITIMKEASTHAEKFNIEEYLYYGDSMSRINHLIGEHRSTRFISEICTDDLTPKETWKRMIEFLVKERRVNEHKRLFTIKPDIPKKDDGKQHGNRRNQCYHTPTLQPSSEVKCPVCDSPDGTDEHVSTSGPKGSRILQYYTCKDFVNKSPAERLTLLKAKRFCVQCLYPGADASSGKHSEGKCQWDFICPHVSHQKDLIKKHVLVCEEHKSHKINQDILQRFVQRFIRNPALPSFANKISLHKINNDHCDDRGIYLLQKVRIDGKDIMIFYDNGCSDFVISQKCVNMLGSRVKKISSQPVTLGGVGNIKTHSNSGMYSIKIPLFDGTEVSFSGACLQHITEKLPNYPLRDVENDIKKCYKSSGSTGSLPKLPSSIGGEVHMMIGVKYLRYHPKMVFQLSSGLAIYESKFNNSTGGRGVVGGPHQIFTEIHRNFNSTLSTFFTNEFNCLQMNSSNVPLLGFDESSFNNEYCDNEPINMHSLAHISTSMRVFEQVEAAGSEISYRCPQCRNCKSCKHGSSSNNTLSIKEEVEQNIINSSVTIDECTSTITALLPFIADPTTRLVNNKDKAMKVYTQQLRKLNNPSNLKEKQDILESEQKLQQMGYVEYLHNLPEASQIKLQSAKIHYFIPWRAVWKGNSISTPCRVVFDASQTTSSGYSLNDIIAKGSNNLNKLQDILLRWFVQPVAIATDIKKMYNTINLDEEHWTYQRYLWEPELDVSKQPLVKIIKTLIYGVKSSGNQAEYALRKVADMSKGEFPEINEVIHNNVYVDDGLDGAVNLTEAHHRADELEVVLNRGGFQLKGVAFSGEDPPPSLSDDGEIVYVAGMKWFVKSDMLALNIGDLNFAKKNRGKKPSHLENIIPSKLTRRHCASKVAEVFDLSGKISPLIASMKIDLQELVHRCLDWDDVIPDCLRPIWESNFEMIKDMATLKFRRAVVPIDAVNLDISTIDFGDASHSMVCVAIYVRFLRKNGKFSCQLLFSRTRTVPKDQSQPRSELYAALINSHTGEIVKRSLSKWHQSSIKLTDSQVVLHWIDNEEKPLKQWVRNRVVEIKRFTTKKQWYYVNTSQMIADIGTRRGATLDDVNDESTWINGYDWMTLDQSCFPISSAQELKLNEEELTEVCKEAQLQIHHVESIFPSEELQERYKFSKYLIDPNYRRFSCVVRILAYVIRFCNCLIKKRHVNYNSPQLSEDEISAAEQYFYRKATNEIINFIQPKKYKPISTYKEGLLIYNGRILSESKVSIVGRFTDSMLDLSASSFCVPIIDKNSPVAFSIVYDMHWNNKMCMHSGIETTLRQILKKVFIIEGRSLIKSIKKSCERCRYINKKKIEAIMGPLPKTSLTIAPAFYSTQLDLSGPYLSYSPAHKRTTTKLWLVVYCCCSTSAVAINVMDDYSSSAFIHAFTRFASRYGFPKNVFCDEGSQLVKGTQDMRLTFVDIKSKLHRDQSVEVQACPVGGHNVNGKVERKIKEINLSLEKFIHNQRLSILQWETIAAVIANTINNLPLAVGNVVDVENIDLLTPNRLLLGRNNDRSPSGNFIVSQNPSKLLKENVKIYDSWFETWLLNHVPKLMQQTKWFQHDRNLQIGDIVLFTKVDSALSKTYTYGMVSQVECGDDGNIRRVKVKYQNENENVKRETSRSVRSLVLIHSIDDLDVQNELFEMSTVCSK